MNNLQILFQGTSSRIAKPLASSFLRNLTTAELCCWKNNPQPLFRVERKGMREVVTEQKVGNHLDSFIELDLTQLESDANDAIILINPSALCLRNPDHLWPEQIQGEFSSTQPDLLWMEDRKERLRGSPFAALLTEEELANYGHRLEANGMNGSQRLFTHFEKNLTAQGIIGREGSIVDASFVAAPRQRNTREQNEKIKAGERPEGFEQSSAKGKQKDCDARWVVKNKEVHYGYKNHIKADAKTKLIINYSTTPANVHDS